MAKLAINGGKPVRTKLFPAYNTIGEEEKRAVMKVLDSGNLSQFLGAWHKDFYGGPTVQQFEKDWASFFGNKYAISVNSNTSGLFTAIGALGIKAGDEVIVSPYTMSASALAPVIYGAVPVFADVDYNNYGLDPESVERCITPRTKAILVVHIFGNPARMDEIMAIARKHNLYVIEDCAQAPMATYKDKYVGSIGDIGIFSLNYHKHIHTGEGGIVVTNNDQIAERVYLIRNHGENIVEPKGIKDVYNTFGYNYRMTEMEAAVGIEQLKKLPALIEERLKNAAYMATEFGKIEGFTPPLVESSSKHVYYLQAIKYKKEILGVDRNTFINALKAEIPSAILREDTPLISPGYVKPLYLQPLYQQRATHCSFNCEKYKGSVDYSKGICPNAEKLHFDELFTHEYMRPGMSKSDLDDVIAAFRKVAENINELKVAASA
ncbi:DegT/DnrJ/EryC1/StrS family aminotransferase [Longitalea arenae]|uniref:DegT/DnrJ/EryC1/StrS family aminotransferase n=1 Tax=Longitalea arenae TaxID=2812558 RepID=UPI0019683F4E|nr:DegT/DnrJ/EryC1/StrS family aminotransferase [Longitalea arenae]